MITIDATQSALIILQGEYDLARQGELHAQLQAAYGLQEALIDMRSVKFMDASALTELIGLKKHMSPPATVRIVGVRPNIRRLLNITGLSHRFDLSDEPAGVTAAGETKRHERAASHR